MFGKLFKPDIERMQAKKDVKGLIRLLKHKDWWVRREAAEALGHVPDARAVKPLLVQVVDAPPLHDMRVEAARALKKISDSGLIEPFVECLQDRNVSIRRQALEFLGVMEGGGVVGPLIRALRDDDWVVRRRAASFLGKIGDLSAVEPLVQALSEDANHDVRREAAGALGHIRDVRAVDSLLQALCDDKDRHVSSNSYAALVEIGIPATERLIQCLRDVSPNVRKSAAEVLGGIRDARAVEPLIDVLLKDQDGDVRYDAVEAVGRINDTRAIEPLLELLMRKSENIPVRGAAATALGRINGIRVIGPLLELLMCKSENIRLREAVAGALGMMRREEAVEPLISVLEELGFTAIEALGNIGDARAIVPIYLALEGHKMPMPLSPSEDPFSFERSLEKEVRKIRLDEGAMEPLIQVLRSHWKFLRKIAAEALGEIGDEKVVEPLTQALDDADWEVKTAAKRSLEMIKKRLA